MGSRLRVGWIVGDQLDGHPWVRESALTGGGVGLARYLWLSRHVNRSADSGVRYEIYRPWRRYDAVLFLKSMGERPLALLRRLQARGIPCIFDCNVNYFETGGTEYYRGMLPTEGQRQEAVAMARAAAAVIGDSEVVAERCRAHNARSAWIPDNVPMQVVPEFRPTRPGARLRLLWSGEAVKLFELLAAAEALAAFAARIELVLVTNDLAALDRLNPEVRQRLDRLLSVLSVKVIAYRSLSQLFEVYAEGGVLLSPRFLDNPYNLGHTEWKITLAMACGRVAICSPVPSYATVSRRAADKGIRVCAGARQWAEAFETLLGGSFRWREEEAAARSVVERYYATAVIGPEHAALVRNVVEARDAAPQRLPAGG